ncbi:hypothetical protein EDD37DRAFT_651181 [Exophiala viscosa]|uniref:uncharacterized protein n=1 Tax=Exophiala viscosa TaxID=2486360 RepID=UPI00219EBE8F|nr:hypothetical protein EDD37DRAFT_651181 [Exophiala viscosa]
MSSGSTSTSTATVDDDAARRHRRHQRQYQRQDSHSTSVSLPDRKSSLSQDKRPRTSRRSSRKDTATLHRQSCLLFESLDGVLALNGESGSVPSLSPPSTRATTRRTSLEPAIVGGDDQFAAVDGKESVSVGRPIQVHSHSYSYSSRKTSISSYGYRDSRHSESLSASPSRGQSQSPYYYRDPFDHRVTQRMSVSTERISPLVGRTYGDDDGNAGVDNSPPPIRPHFNTVISWTSDASRRTEYAKIDRAHSGVRGFWRRVMPKCLHKDGRRAFFSGDSDCDADSVRRFRLDLDADADADSDTEAEDNGDAYGEKIDSQRAQGRSLDGEKGPSPTEHTIKTNIEVSGKDIEGRKNWWTCFQ